MMVITKAFTEQRGLQAGSRVDIAISSHELRTRPVRAVRLTLDQLLRNTRATTDVRAWVERRYDD